MRVARLWGMTALALASTGAFANALPTNSAGEFCATDASAMGAVSVPALTIHDKSDANLAFEMAQLHAWLSANAPSAKLSPVTVELTASERTQLGYEGDGVVRSNERRLQVGVSKPLGIGVDLARANGLGQGVLERTSEGLTWTIELTSPGAAALRVAFENLDLPQAASLYVYNAEGEAHGPYGGRGIAGSGNLHSNTVGGDTVRVQLQYRGNPSVGDLARLRFDIASLGHISPRFEAAARMNPKAAAANAKAFCSYNASCVVSGECSQNWSALAATREGVAHMLFPSGGGYYICSGGLLNNTNNDGRLLFLTANHCISQESEANGLETFWDYRATGCTSGFSPCDYSYATMRTTYPTALGATIRATGTAGDYSLMELLQKPSGTLTFLPWTNVAVATTTATLHRLSHPSGAPQAYSRQNVTPSSFTCRTLSRGPYIYSQDVVGATEGGSSGSPVLDGTGQVVGQLYGACGSNLNDECDSVNNRTVDGALAYYYPNVSAYLAPSGGGGGGTGITASVASNVVTVASQGPWKTGRATVRIVDQNGQAVANATVSGSWSGVVSGSASGTTGSDGTVVISSAKTKSTGTFTFCVTNVSGTNITYSGGSVCDSN